MQTLLVVGCLLALVLLSVTCVLLPLHRSRGLERRAQEAGFRFAASAKPFEGTDVRGLTILEDNSSTVVDNVLERMEGGCRILIFDVLPLDESASLVTTVAAFRFSDLHLPSFQIAAKDVIERVIERAEEALGKKLSDFDTDQEFARHFFVHCSDQGDVRTLLTPAKVSYLRDHAAHFHLEGSPDWLLIYHPGFKVDAEHLQEFAELTSAIASTLLSIQAPPFRATA